MNNKNKIKNKSTGGRHSTASLHFNGKLLSLARRKIVREVGRLCKECGVSAYLVGGAVRNCILSIDIDPDFDFAIIGDAEKLGAAIARKLGGTSFVLDKKLMSYRVVTKGGTIARVIDLIPLNGADITEDLAKRDFTVNAMAVGLHAEKRIELIDPCNGTLDAKKKLLRLVSTDAIDDDPIRSVRAVRLARQYGLKIVEDTLITIRSKALLLSNVSIERIRDELTIICALPDASGAISDLFELGLSDVIFPELSGWMENPVYDILGHTLKTIAALQKTFNDAFKGKLGIYSEKLSRHLHLRIAGSGSMKRSMLLTIASLLHDAGKLPKMSRIEGRLRFIGHDLEGSLMADALLRRLRFSSATATEVARLVRNHHRLFDLARLPNRTDRSRAHFFKALGGAPGLDLIILALSDARATRGEVDMELERVAKEMFDFYFSVYMKKRPRPLFTGVQVMRTFGVKPGKVVGEILALISVGIESGEVTTKAEAIEYVRDRRK